MINGRSCENFIQKNDLIGLIEWLEEGNCEVFVKYITENINKCSTFICEHTYLLYFGKVKKILNVFKDEEMNVVASSLGSVSIYKDGKSNEIKDEFKEVKDYKKPDNFIEIYKKACEKVDPDMCFSSVIQILRQSKEDLPELLKILSKVINQTEKGKSSLITNSLVSIRGYIEENKKVEIMPLLEFVESIWKNKDQEDKQEVGSSSLKVFCTNLISEIKSGEVETEYLEEKNKKEDVCLEIANIVCKFNQNIFNWICSLSLVHSAPVSGPLDNIPLNEGICIYILMESRSSLFPKVYRHKTMGLMLFKLSHMFITNVDKSNKNLKLKEMGLKAGEKAINYLDQEGIKNELEVIESINMFPWQPVGYLCTLLNKVEEEYEINKASFIFRKVLSLSKYEVKVHILKGVMKSVKSEVGTSLCLMECKKVTEEWKKEEDEPKSQVNFVKYILDTFFGSEIYKRQDDSTYDALSVVLNWIKYLISKNGFLFKKFIEINYLEILKKMYNNLNEKVSLIDQYQGTTHPREVLLNKLELIKMLVNDVFNLMKVE